MTRLVIMTVGKTHSGKSTFARSLEEQLLNSIVIDQDAHAEFINTFYRSLLPMEGPNTLKYAVSQTIVDYAMNETSFHLILCNSNLSRSGRLKLLEHFKGKGFTTILIHLDIPDRILQARVVNSERSTAIFRNAATFEEVLSRQQTDAYFKDVAAPVKGEADHLYIIRHSDEVQNVIGKIIDVAHRI
ncbi:ATP-binding protein [Rossellomorea yichunensis]|uniref:ATP-binding protein n=1 Tax=Rossellomorea yichunensis TaxID=3077331 RepID=UPI0028DD4C8D|nr:ATP-binding protein [Rossellomorea sp. YC4-1]MDT9024773.1 ATP-binding protein [Rossellomorea sp. YC4-1]